MIQYKHDIGQHAKGGLCQAIIPPDILLIRRAMDAQSAGMAADLQMMYGEAKCHPKDAYVKSIGRTIAEANMKSIPIRINSISFADKRAVIYVSSKELNVYTVLVYDYERMKMLFY